ncbi:MAG TPA: TIGR00282 family metallophosphoesterase [bacterium]|nr:TIGR00282 family metallophosphoesterase [bacterium]
MASLRILMLGDIIGRPGRKMLLRLLPGYRTRHGISCVIANGENSSGGMGIQRDAMDDLFTAGVDVITTGNHVWHRKEVHELLKKEPRLLRPANYPARLPGLGHVVVERGGVKIGVLNLLGRVFMEPMDNPFEVAERELTLLREAGAQSILVDFHAEATAEKEAMAFHLDGRVSLLAGTHTHVQTSDEKIFPDGMGYITDLGRCGSFFSVLGVEYPASLEGFLTCTNKKFTPAKDSLMMEGVIADIDPATGRAVRIERIREQAEAHDE